jgi:hypothetical protein
VPNDGWMDGNGMMMLQGKLGQNIWMWPQEKAILFFNTLSPTRESVKPMLQKYFQ